MGSWAAECGGGRLGDARATFKEFNKSLWDQNPRGTLSEPRLNLVDANERDAEKGGLQYHIWLLYNTALGPANYSSGFQLFVLFVSF